ncbi:ABC transporter substrate-binding protein [Carnobacterium sp. ISL-102]|uniref:ABC transporter substrate-binding protein n=1 Tax=Carnobacterium sp. ISL-102 TaxID=2819142 RepID=UPI001BE737CF|nr:ABC transporter substrate-binding protein [Carnobacterium sp. ISL-102]MBT2732353.1 ABC transporter substrate-binding protein [Carnobacterium sp. ISL-102]
MKKLVRLLIAIILVGAAAIALAACSTDAKTVQSNEASSSDTVNEPLRFGTLPAESAIPIILAEENGYFEDENVAVDITPFSSPNDRNAAAQSGELDGMIADVMTALSFREGGIDLTITSDINEEFKLLSSPDSGIIEIKQLDGKNVSLIPKLLLEYIMDEIAAKNEIGYEVVSIPSIPARYEALLENQIDSVIFTEPQATALKINGAHVLASSSDYGIKGGTILFSDESVAERSTDIAAFYRAYDKAVDYINTTDPVEYSTSLNEYNFPKEMGDYLSNKEEGYTKAKAVTKEQYASIEEWTKEKEMISKDYAYEELTDFSMLKE